MKKQKQNWLTSMTRHSFALVLCAGLSAAAWGATTSIPQDAAKESAEDKTALLKRERELHKTRADFYAHEAKNLEQEIDVLWKKYAQERKKIAVLPKSVNENPYVKKLRAQTEREEMHLRELIRSAQDMSRYHQARLKELLDDEKDISSLK